MPTYVHFSSFMPMSAPKSVLPLAQMMRADVGGSRICECGNASTDKYPGDPLLRKLKTRVISAEKATIAAPPAQKGKSTKRRAATDAHGLGNTVAGEAKEGTVLWEVVTEDTVIFPEGTCFHDGHPSPTPLIPVWIEE